jgi:hypothetical protein
MLTYTGSRNLFGKLATDSSSATLTLADTLINLFTKKISKKFNFLEDTAIITSVASQQFYDLPIDFGRFKNLYTTSGTTNYYPTLITSRKKWDEINATTSTTGDVPQYVFIFNGQIGFYPKFASASISSTLIYHKKQKDLSVADYTTGTITSITNGAAAMVGSTTVWTSAMIGRYITIPISQGGDGEWYKISAVGSNTTLTLDRNYEGTSIAAATATYTIGEVSFIPEDYQPLPVFEALTVYFTSVKPDTTKAATYKVLAQEMNGNLMEEFGSVSLDPRISEEVCPENINNYSSGSAS